MCRLEGQGKDSPYRVIMSEGETWLGYCIIYNSFDDRDEGLIFG